jgi:hypothetical protein
MTLVHEPGREPEGDCESGEDPRGRNDDGRSAARRAFGHGTRLSPVFLKQLSGDELYGEQDTERNDHEVIGVAEDGHEVGDKIDGERA